MAECTCAQAGFPNSCDNCDGLVSVQGIADYLYEETTKLDAPISYTACLVLAKRILRAQPSLIQNIEAEARRYAEMYPQSSDGRNTFVIFADWVAAQAAAAVGTGKQP